MYDKKCVSVTSHALDPSPVIDFDTFSDHSPSSVTYFMHDYHVALSILALTSIISADGFKIGLREAADIAEGRP